MPEIVFLKGRQALSQFRLDKLSKEVQAIDPQISEISAVFWHFVELDNPLSREQLIQLDQILAYGPKESKSADDSADFVVVPRLGSISPWSTKATDIAKACGLMEVSRIERGVVWSFKTKRHQSASQATLKRIVSMVHDRITETVLVDINDAKKLFRHVQPQPLRTIPVLKDGRRALEDCDREMGLALSPDEIDYLQHNFERIGRDPTDVELMMFAQANSEHCRHKIFNASWIIDGQAQDYSLFGMIRETHRQVPQGHYCGLLG